MYNEGISVEGNIIDVGVKEEIIQKSGAWFSYGEIRLGQGRENAKQYLKENPDIEIEIETKIRQKNELPLKKANNEKKTGEETEKEKEKKLAKA